MLKMVTKGRESKMTKHTRLLIVFAKTPEVGQVKTRIGVNSGMQAAAAIYGKMLETTLTISATNKLWEQIITITPESEEAYFKERGLTLTRQCGVGLGNRMSNALETGFQEGAEQIIIIGSDCPTLSRLEIAEAFSLLNKVPAVIGPSADGGFYLIGVTRTSYKTVAQVFREVSMWSTSQVFAEVQERCQSLALPLVKLPIKKDVDTYEDWLDYTEQLVQR